MDLAEIRKRINMIDFEILKLLNRRMEYALRTKRLKSSVADPKRESEVIRYIHQHSQGLIEPEFCEMLFAKIISESKRLQIEDLRLIGFQGEHGAFSEVAAFMFNPNLIYISCSEFREIFEAVEQGLLQFGIVPVESTLGGTVNEVNEFLANTDLKIIGEIKIPIHYSLVALPESDHHEIRVVYSHRHALSQCQGFLTKRNLEGRPYYDSAGAAKMLLQERPNATAAIASSFAAEFYNLEVLEENIEDFPNNFTRFLILARETEQQNGNKCTIFFGTEHRAGALFGALKEFADAGINLTRIESMPNRRDPGSYVFFLDFDGSIKDKDIREALERVKHLSSSFKVLGCYPAHSEQSS